MENQISISAEELKRELEKTINVWVERTFNYIQVGVLEKYCDNTLVDYIRSKSVEESFEDWLGDCDTEIKIKSWVTETEEYWLTNNDELNVDTMISEYKNHNGSIKESFAFAFGDKWEEFKEWSCEEYEDDIYDWINEQENYPMWNTCFEFRDSFYNQEESIDKCLSVGLGVIEGLDDFNNLLFMTSAGHSFYSAYWIPLYLKLFPTEAEKFAGINYSDL
jgi:hypothetical protein